MSLLKVWLCESPIEFDTIDGCPSRRETLTKDCWYLNTELRWGEGIVMILHPHKSHLDNYMRFRCDNRCALDRVSRTWSKHPYSFSMLKRQLKIK